MEKKWEHFTLTMGRNWCDVKLDAKEYLLRVAEKYHIPEDEIELTKKQLVSYTKEKEMLKERGEWDE